MEMQKYANQTTLPETIMPASSTMWVSLVQSFPLPAVGGEIETAYNIVKHRK
jgi:hypothetical protein